MKLRCSSITYTIVLCATKKEKCHFNYGNFLSLGIFYTYGKSFSKKNYISPPSTYINIYISKISWDALKTSSHSESF